MAGTALSGLLLAHFDWPVTFYFFGALGVAWYVLWLLLCYSTPEEHPFISDAEREYLHSRIKAHNLGKVSLGLSLSEKPCPQGGEVITLPRRQ